MRAGTPLTHVGRLPSADRRVSSALPLGIGAACDAVSSPVSLVEVAPAQRVPTLAGLLSEVRCCDTRRAQSVYPSSDGFQVVGVDATPDTAQVVDVEPSGDLPDELLVRPSVRNSVRPTASHESRLEFPVSTVCRTRPTPAGRHAVRKLVNRNESEETRNVSLAVVQVPHGGIVYRLWRYFNKFRKYNHG